MYSGLKFGLVGLAISILLLLYGVANVMMRYDPSSTSSRGRDFLPLWTQRKSTKPSARYVGAQSIPKRPSDLFPAPLYCRSMAAWLSSQQQNSLLIYEKEKSCEIIENLHPMCKQYTLELTLWSAVFKCDKRQSDKSSIHVSESNYKKERLTTYDIYLPLIVRFDGFVSKAYCLHM